MEVRKTKQLAGITTNKSSDPIQTRTRQRSQKLLNYYQEAAGRAQKHEAAGAGRLGCNGIDADSRPVEGRSFSCLATNGDQLAIPTRNILI